MSDRTWVNAASSKPGPAGSDEGVNERDHIRLGTGSDGSGQRNGNHQMHGKWLSQIIFFVICS